MANGATEQAIATRRSWLTGLGAVVGAMGLLLATWVLSTGQTSGPAQQTNTAFGAEVPQHLLTIGHSTTQTADHTPPTQNDERYRRLIVGNWEQFNHGKRLVTVHDDGTAMMVVEPDGLWRLLFGKRLQFDIQWTLEAGQLTFHITGGQPQAKTALVTKRYGRRRCQPIVELTDDRLLLYDKDEQEQTGWTRVVPGTL